MIFFVTGGSRGIGRGIVLRLAQQGARVGIGYYRNEGAARETISFSTGFLSENVFPRSPWSISVM